MSDMPKLKTVIVELTPDEAEKLLAFNSHNRPVKQSIVDRYANAMLAGKWRLHHQGIAFTDETKDRVLVDGQHRLYALWWLGTQGHKDLTVPFQITYGVPIDTQLLIDDHTKRTVLDVATLQRGLGQTTKSHVSAAKVMMTLGLGIDGSMITNQRTIEFVKRYWDGLDFVVSQVFNNQRRRGITQAPVMAVCVQAYYCDADRERLKQFGNMLLDKAMSSNQEDYSGVLLRAWLTGALTSRGGGGGHAGVIYRKTQRALYTFLKKGIIAKLYESPEQLFPLPGAQKFIREAPRVASVKNLLAGGAIATAVASGGKK